MDEVVDVEDVEVGVMVEVAEVVVPVGTVVVVVVLCVSVLFSVMELLEGVKTPA